MGPSLYDPLMSQRYQKCFQYVPIIDRRQRDELDDPMNSSVVFIPINLPYLSKQRVKKFMEQEFTEKSTVDLAFHMRIFRPLKGAKGPVIA